MAISKTPACLSEHKCLDCGADLSGTSARTLRCRKCAHKRNLMQQKIAHRKEREKVQALRGKSKCVGDCESRCLYCGKESFGRKYCTLCEQAGFNEVHKMYGITNGWDRKLKLKVRVVDGNRGVLPGGNRRVYDNSAFKPRAVL